MMTSCTSSNNINPSQTTEKPFNVELLWEGSDVVWGFDFLSDSEVIFTHRSGQLMLLDLKSSEAKPLEGGPRVFARRQGGLLDVLVHEIEGEKYVYLTYSEYATQKQQSTVSLGRGVWSSDSKLLNFERLFQADAFAPPGRHYGSRIIFDDDGYLFMTVGDRGVRNEAQNLRLHHGTVLRLTALGEAAPGNPFIDRDDALDEIWSYGHRNQQGIDIHPETRELWTIEFGPKGGDEVNLIKPGLNYGWPKMTYGREYSGAYIAPSHVEGMEQPITHFTPAISPSGMTFYDSDVFPDWKNNLIIAALGDTHIHRIVFDPSTNEVLEQKRYLDELGERMRQVRLGPDGHIYFSTDSGIIGRLTPQ